MDRVYNTPYEVVKLQTKERMVGSVFSETPFFVDILNEFGKAQVELVAQDLRRIKTKIGGVIHTTFRLQCRVLGHETDYEGERRIVNEIAWLNYNPKGTSSMSGLYAPPLLTKEEKAKMAAR